VKVYLAGPITGISWGEATNWRDGVKAELAKHGLRGFSPLRGKEYLSNEKEIDPWYNDKPMSAPKGLVTRDRFDVRTSDVIIANFLGAERVSIGTCMEVAWADVYNTPVIAVMEPDNVHVHAFIMEMCGYIVPDLDEAVDIAVRMLTP
jgi:nucleoside 2-deoxyribosyltransferase